MTVPTLLILGSDVVLAAQPATPVQLWHACLAVGYHAVIPSTWGDELIAARIIEHFRAADGPVIQCSCPLVARRLATHGASLEPMLLSLVSPPVATAEYLRALYAPTKIHLTFAGACAGGAHQSIDAWASVDDLMREFEARGISLSTQPREFDSTLPPDRRRFYSEPGGVPSRAALQHLPSPVGVCELSADDFIAELAQHLLSGTRSLIDVAPAVRCGCSGSVENVQPEEARARVRALEPPRAFAPVLDHSVALGLNDASSFAATVPPVPIEEREVAATGAGNSSLPREVALHDTPPSIEPVTDSVQGLQAASRTVVGAPPRRLTPSQSRPVLGAMPLARTDAGRQLPRAYVARRRSSPRGFRQSTLRRVEPPTSEMESPGTRKWLVVGAAGLGGGLMLAWFLRWI